PVAARPRHQRWRDAMAGPRKTRRRKKHRVDLALTARDITRLGTSVQLEVFAEGVKLGDLDIGSGSVAWRGRHRRSWKRIDWTRFAELMEQVPYAREIRQKY